MRREGRAGMMPFQPVPVLPVPGVDGPAAMASPVPPGVDGPPVLMAPAPMAPRADGQHRRYV